MSREPASFGLLHREHVLNPITALSFYTSSTDGQQYVLAGEDTDIKIYHVQTSRLCGCLPVFRAQSIHGIAVPPTQHPGQVLVWGAYSIKVLPGDIIEALISGRSNEQDLTRPITETRAPDWIFDGRISPFGGGRIVLLTAHNEVIQAHVNKKTGSLVFDSIQSPSRPILYSGNFFWVSQDCVLVAAGTVFGEILVWKCYLETSTHQQNCEVLFVFTGHEGSIFGVHISPEIQTTGGEALRLLVSCSDDRTIRVWDITERNRDQTQNGYENRISDARETGFGNNEEITALDDSSARCLATAMGHASRIWQVEFPEDQPLFQTSNIVELYSFGEDATAQKWNLPLNLQLSGTITSGEPSEKPAAKLTHQLTSSNHGGKHIWSHAMVSKGDDSLIATGGSDGKIALIGTGVKNISPRIMNGNANRTHGNGKAITWSLTDVLQSSQPSDSTKDTPEPIDPSSSLVSPPRASKPKNAKEAFNRYTFISDSRLLAATNSGRIFLGVFEDKLTWTELILPEEIGQIVFSHALFGSSVAYPIALVGTSNGDVYHFSESENRSLRLLTKVDGKVADIFCLSNSRIPSNGGQLEFLVTILRNTKAVIISVNPNTSTIKHVEFDLEPGFMVTAAAFTQGHLVLGSRKGIIAVLKRGEDGTYSSNFSIEVHRDEAITSILPLHSRDNQPSDYILSTCRDGKYRIHEIITTGSESSAALIHETLPPFVSSVEGAWFSDNGNGTQDLMLCGFRSNKFVVWNETQRHEVATVDCGGSSRSYAWAPLRHYPDGFRFVFTKAGQMHVFSQTLAPHKALKSGGHGREIKAVSASAGRYIATAAEDTVIRIWGYEDANNDNPRLRCVAALEKHATGIQVLKWYKDEYLFSSGGNEEFFVWKLSQLESGDFSGLAVVCEAVFPDRTDIGDARITDFDVDCAEDGGDGAYEFTISMTLSNSTLQTYVYTQQAGFRLLRRHTYTGACLTQVRHLGKHHILAAATDGHLTIYTNTERGLDESSADSEPLPVVTKLHQNTIKSLDVRQLPAVHNGGLSEYLIVTGGDDNALGSMRVSFPSSPTNQEKPGVTIKSKSIIRSAHAAALTGVAIARLDGGEDAAYAVTGSNDQRVKLWRLAGYEGKQLKAQLLDERYSSIADTGNLEIFGSKDEDEDKGKKRVVVAGVGIEVWELRI
ncbi:WD40 repeat-like protein [Hypoxylon trugodes]|uniref:WD40 repeat-like protein n=1 Tax=Hypoxylon trugodes TaxID=326681 RepID=UPI002197471C|nr:WD40 repeat-like protein [Hypoxylon trugodes]KAI1392756.1 WD40 repeat-like protein [Hypoxylon trugodes]